MWQRKESKIHSKPRVKLFYLHQMNLPPREPRNRPQMLYVAVWNRWLKGVRWSKQCEIRQYAYTVHVKTCRPLAGWWWEWERAEQSRWQICCRWEMCWQILENDIQESGVIDEYLSTRHKEIHRLRRRKANGKGKRGTAERKKLSYHRQSRCW